MTNKYLNQLQQDFDKIIRYSQGFAETTPIDSSNILHNWYENKNRFMEVLNVSNNFIYEYPEEVELPLDETSKTEKFMNFVYDVYCMGYISLKEFLESQGMESLFENKVKRTYIYNGITINEGMKLLKAMKFFCSDSDKLEDIQNYASRIIQENKIKGTLCLSINPLDYLSISENQHKWRSCHALDGEYRSGNLSYLQDSSTIIAYIKSKGNCKLPHFPEDIPWNNKKWRVLLYISPHGYTVFAGKQYPFFLDNGLSLVKKALEKIKVLPIGETYGWWNQKSIIMSDWSNEYITEAKQFGKPIHLIEGTYIATVNKIIKKSDLVKNELYSTHYNDVLTSPTYIAPYYMFATLEEHKESPLELEPIIIGHPVKCVCCGQHYPEEDSMICEECYDNIEYADGYYHWECSICGRHINDMDDVCNLEGDIVCYNCFDEVSQECDWCGHVGYHENFYRVQNTINYEDWWYCCEDCKNQDKSNRDDFYNSYKKNVVLSVDLSK